MGGEQDIVLEDEGGAPVRVDALKQVRKAMNVSLKDVNISNEGKVIVAGREESGRTLMEVDGPFSCSLAFPVFSTFYFN